MSRVGKALDIEPSPFHAGGLRPGIMTYWLVFFNVCLGVYCILADAGIVHDSLPGQSMAAVKQVSFLPFTILAFVAAVSLFVSRLYRWRFIALAAAAMNPFVRMYVYCVLPILTDKPINIWFTFVYGFLTLFFTGVVYREFNVLEHVRESLERD